MQDFGRYRWLKNHGPSLHSSPPLVDTNLTPYHSLWNSALELFQKRMNTLFADLKGVLCLMDDVLVYGKNQIKHDEQLEAILKCIDASGMTLNTHKCEISKTQLKFLGHIIDQDGIRADPAKTDVVTQMPAPKNVTEV